MVVAAEAVTVEDENNGAYLVKYTLPPDTTDDVVTVDVTLGVRGPNRPCV
jgi:hypothetical protein